MIAAQPTPSKRASIPPATYRDGRPDPFSRESMRNGIRHFIETQGFTHSLTLNSNRDLSIPNIRSMFGNFCRRVDQDRFKKRHVERLPSCFRFRAIAFVEHAASYPHLHLAIDLGPTWLASIVDDRLGRQLQAHWIEVTDGAGSIQLDPIACIQGWSRYITKNYRRDDEYFLSSDFHSDKSLIQSAELRQVLEAIAA
jgi:hypothetical protein